MIKLKPLILLSFLFIIFTIFGTLSHEYGHIAFAKYLGYDISIHYRSMQFASDDYKNEIDKHLSRT